MFAGSTIGISRGATDPITEFRTRHPNPQLKMAEVAYIGVREVTAQAWPRPPPNYKVARRSVTLLETTLLRPRLFGVHLSKAPCILEPWRWVTHLSLEISLFRSSSQHSQQRRCNAGTPTFQGYAACSARRLHCWTIRLPKSEYNGCWG